MKDCPEIGTDYNEKVWITYLQHWIMFKTLQNLFKNFLSKLIKDIATKSIKSHLNYRKNWLDILKNLKNVLIQLKFKKQIQNILSYTKSYRVFLIF